MHGGIKMKPLKNLPKAEELAKALQYLAENGTQSTENVLDMLLDGLLLIRPS